MKNIIKNPTRLLYHNPVSLVTSTYDGKKNVFTVSWLSVISNNPPAVMISVDKKRFSFYLIEKSKKFVINIPNVKILKDVIYCGNVSAREKDKFQERNLKYITSKNDGVILDKTIAYLECKITKEIDLGDRMLFIGEIIDAGANEDVFSDGKWNLENGNSKIISFLGDGNYATISQIN